MKIKKSSSFIFFILLFATLIRLFFIFQWDYKIDEKIMADLVATVSLDNIPVHYNTNGGESIAITYLALPFVHFFSSPPILTFRFISLISNLGFILLLFLFLKKFFSERVALIASFLLSIWPWSIMAGVIGYNAYLLPLLYTAGLYFLFLSLKEKKVYTYFLSMIFWSISFYAYTLSFFWVPLFLIIFFIIYRKDIILKFFIPSLIFLFFLTLPISLFFLKNQFNLITLDSFLFFELPNLYLTRFSSISVFNLYSGVNIFLNYLFNYFLHFVLIFLSYNPNNHSLLFYFTYFWDVMFIVLGIIFCFKNFSKNRKYKFLIIWFLAYPLASSFVNATTGFSFTRDVHALPLLAILSSLGIIVFIKVIKDIYLIYLADLKFFK